MGDTVDATFHVQIEPEWSRWARTDGEKDVDGARMTNATQSRPRTAKPGSVLVKITLRLPKAVFYPLRPEAIITIPASMVESVPIEVIAENPEENL